LKVIGAGMGRTGTMSTLLALTELGCNCAHMKSLIETPRLLNIWAKIAQEKKATGKFNLDLLKEACEGFDAVVDAPWCFVYRELMALSQNATVLLNVRDADRWVASLENTVYFSHELVEGPLGRFLLAVNKILFPAFARQFEMVNTLWWDDLLGPDESLRTPEARARVAKWFTEWNESVIRNVPKDRLVVFRVEEGWTPLCSMLGVPEPMKAFPNVNDTQEMQKIAQKIRLAWYGLPTVAAVALVGLLVLACKFLL